MAAGEEDEQWRRVLTRTGSTPVSGPSTRVRPRGTNGGGGKAGDRDEKDATSGGVATLHIPILETPAAGPSVRVRPRVTDSSDGKEDDQSKVEGCEAWDGHMRRAKREIRTMQYGWCRAKRQACIRRGHNE